MGNQAKNFCLPLASRGLAFVVALSMAVPAIPTAHATDPLDAPVVGQGDTAPAMPEIGRICEVLRNAKDGKFVGKDGKTPTTFTDPSCAGKSRRERNATGAMGVDANGAQVSCQQNVDTLTANMSPEDRATKIDSLCKSASGTLNQEAATYCTLRAVAQTGQATEYCEAYESADKAQKGTTVTLALDVAAAGICWAEFLSMQALIKEIQLAKAQKRQPNLSGKMGVGSVLNSGACGGAAMAASVGELVQTARILIGGKKSGGEYKIDSDNNRQDKKNLGKVFEIFLSAGLSLKGLQLGVCYYGSDKKLCEGLNGHAALSKQKVNAKTIAEGREIMKDKELTKKIGAAGEKLQKTADDINQAHALSKEAKGNLGNTRISKKSVYDAYAAAKTEEYHDEVDDYRELKDKLDHATEIFEAATARANLAKQAGIVFTGLAAMRGAALMSAGTTKKKSKEILQSMFSPDGGGATLGMSGLGNVQQNIYAAIGGGTYVPPGAQPVRASAVTSGTPEAFMLPPGSGMAAQAERLGSQIPTSRLEEAAMGGGAGIGGMIASAATAAGAKGDLSEMKATTHSMFAAFSQDSGGYAGGGGRAVASTGAKSEDLNLKSLFGAGGEGGGGAEAAAPELAYREPANDDIWHSQNPKGHNLFQIVSDKYDTVQRKSAVGSEL